MDGINSKGEEKLIKWIQMRDLQLHMWEAIHFKVAYKLKAV